jgi:K+-transporting ATPase ATPase C chain
MDFLRDMNVAVRTTIVLWILTAILYPVVLLGVGLIFPHQANGSLIRNPQGEIVGSALIGQPFTSDRYFWGRPSTIEYSTADLQNDPVGILKTGVSGASNLAPSNPALQERIQSEVPRLQAYGLSPAADLIYTSGSGLDPHITPASARAQIERVARARDVSVDQLQALIAQHTDQRFLGIFGDAGVNVLKLNLALDHWQSNS